LEKVTSQAIISFLVNAFPEFDNPGKQDDFSLPKIQICATIKPGFFITKAGM
jgi:hypothetical protein